MRRFSELDIVENCYFVIYGFEGELENSKMTTIADINPSFLKNVSQHSLKSIVFIINSHKIKINHIDVIVNFLMN